MGELVTNTQKITPEMVKANRLIFYPKSEDEARVIQERLAQFGAGWGTGDAPGAHLLSCVQKGFLCEYGQFYYNPSKGGGLLCSVTQLDEKYMPPEQVFLLEQFNKMAAKIDALTDQVSGLKQEVAALKAELSPDTQETKKFLQKPAPRRAGENTP